MGGAGFLSRAKWEGRKTYFVDKEKGYLKEETDWIEEEKEVIEAEKAANPSNDDSEDIINPMKTMFDGFKGQYAFMAQNMIIMNGISYFFEGYILVKIPFPLTQVRTFYIILFTLLYFIYCSSFDLLGLGTGLQNDVPKRS
jgi:hypothetical protein